MTDGESGVDRGVDPVFGVELEVGEEGIGWLRLRPRRGTALPIGLELLSELDARLAEVEAEGAAGSIGILVLETVAPHPALTGYDLEEIRATSEKGIVAWSQEAQSILRRLEVLEVPSIAAIRSDWFGGAAELALSCSYRVATDDGEARIAFPQTRRGFIPAWGGTVRLPRLVGLQEALRLVLSSEPLSGAEGVEIGLVDQVLSADAFDDRLRSFALEKLAGDRGRRRKRPVRRRLLDDTAPGRRIAAARATRLYLGGASANVAARLSLELMIETTTLPLEQAFARESTAAGELIVTTEAQGRLHSERLTQRVARRSPMGRAEFTAAAVLGSGETASDLAHLLVASGTPVRMKGTRTEAGRAVARARSRLAWELRRGHITEQQARRRSERVEAVTGFGGFGLLDLLVAAPDGGDQALLDLLRGAEGHLRDDCLLAYHDWAISPTALQPQLRRPDRLVCLLPTFPADRFPLMEIVPGAVTSPDAVASARRLARRLGLTAVVVSEPMPSPATRLLGIFMAEAIRLLDEGVTIEQIDAAVTDFGFETGPFQRMDAMGLPRVQRLLDSLASSVGERMRPTARLQSVAEAGGTFYRYRGGRPAGQNPSLPEGEAESGEALSVHLRGRLLLLLINEAVRIMEAGGVADPGDLDVISTTGVGFPKEHGGILFYAQEVGLDSLAGELSREARELGERYSPAGLLRDLASTGRSFFAAEARPSSGHEFGPSLQ